MAGRGIGVLFVALALPLAGRTAEPPLRQRIDAEVQKAWQREKIQPAGLADDATFLRRLFLDLVGTIPSEAEARAFLADQDPNKREKLIDRLLADPRFAAHQATTWDLVLFGRHPPGGDATRKRDDFRAWLTQKWIRNEGYDRWVRALLLGEEEGSALFHVQFRGQPEEATVAITRLFLGTQLQCARCHDHPYERWTQRDFYGMAAFFVRLVVVDGPAKGNQRSYRLGEKSTGEVLFSGSAKEQKPGKKGDPIAPRFLGAAQPLAEPALPMGFKEPSLSSGKMPPPPHFSRKARLAEWVTAPDNPYFAQAVANRVWGQFMGRGLVHPVDDLGEKKEPSHPELMRAVTSQLIAHKFDLKWYIRELVNSQTYQRAARGPSTAALPQWFERARVRPLLAEELLASLRVATGTENEKDNSGLKEYVTQYFGEPTNGRGDFQGSLAEHLFLNNSGQVRQMIQPHKGNLADRLLKSSHSWEARVEQMFLATLTRLPTPEEKARFVKHLTSTNKPEPLVGEAIWVLVNCAEFRFNR